MWMDCRFGLHGIVVVRSCMPQCQAREGSCERSCKGEFMRGGGAGIGQGV